MRKLSRQLVALTRLRRCGAWLGRSGGRRGGGVVVRGFQGFRESVLLDLEQTRARGCCFSGLARPASLVCERTVKVHSHVRRTTPRGRKNNRPLLLFVCSRWRFDGRLVVVVGRHETAAANAKAEVKATTATTTTTTIRTTILTSKVRWCVVQPRANKPACVRLLRLSCAR